MNVVHRLEGENKPRAVLRLTCGGFPQGGDAYRWPADFDRLAASNGPWINADEALGHTVAVVPLCLPCLASVDVGT